MGSNGTGPSACPGGKPPAAGNGPASCSVRATTSEPVLSSLTRWKASSTSARLASQTSFAPSSYHAAEPGAEDGALLRQRCRRCPVPVGEVRDVSGEDRWGGGSGQHPVAAGDPAVGEPVASSGRQTRDLPPRGPERLHEGFEGVQAPSPGVLERCARPGGRGGGHGPMESLVRGPSSDPYPPLPGSTR